MGLKQKICTKDMLKSNNYKHLTAYFIFLGECANGQNRNLSRMGMYGYYSFYNKSSSGHLLSISDATKYTMQAAQAYAPQNNAELNELWLFCAGIPTQDRLITIPCLTYLNKINGKIYKITQDAQIIHLEHGQSNSFINHLEFYVLNNLVLNNYRINKEYGILRFPLSDIATSECMTKGIICRASPIFVSEVSNIKHSHFIFPYHIEIECPTTYVDMSKDEKMKQRCKECPNESEFYQLTERKWFIDDNGNIENIRGPGVIGLFPKVFVNEELFQYESCSQQSVATEGRMWGQFVFQRGADDVCHDTFELELTPYKLDWNKCQWI